MNRLTSRWISRRIEFSGDAEIVVRRWPAAWVGTEGAQMRRLAVPMMILLIASHSAFAQERSIAGRVVDADGRAVANASVATSWRANGPLKKPDGTAFDLKEPTQLHEFWGNVGDMAPVESVETTDDGMFAISIQPFDRALFAIDHDRTLGCIVEIPRENEAGQPLILRLVPLVTVVAEFRTSVESVSADWFHAYVELPLDVQNPLGSRRLVSCGSFDRRFEVKLPPGAYRLDAYATSDSAVGSSELSVTPSPAVTVRATDTKIDIGILDLTLGKPGLDDLVRESKQSDRWRDYREHVGQPAPAWHAVDGRRIDHTANLDALRGKWVLLYFWNLGCKPCLAHGIPKMMDFYRKNAKSRGKFEVVGVYVDLDGENKTLADIDKNGLSAIEATVWDGQRIQFPIVLDNSFTTYERYGVPGFGTVVLVDPDGRIAQGDASTLQAFLDKAEPSDAAASP